MSRMRRAFRALILAGGIAGLAVGVTAVPAHAVLPPGAFVLAPADPQYSGNCVTAVASGRDIGIAPCNIILGAQQWQYGRTVVASSDQSLVDRLTFRCATKAGTDVYSAPCGPGGNQLWVQTPLQQIQLAGTDQCWQVSNGAIVLATCASSVDLSQVFVPVPVP